MASLSAKWTNQVGCGSNACHGSVPTSLNACHQMRSGEAQGTQGGRHPLPATQPLSTATCAPQDAIDRAVTAAVGGDPAAIAGWRIDRLIPFNPVDKKTVAEVGCCSHAREAVGRGFWQQASRHGCARCPPLAHYGPAPHLAPALPRSPAGPPNCAAGDGPRWSPTGDLQGRPPDHWGPAAQP